MHLPKCVTKDMVSSLSGTGHWISLVVETPQKILKHVLTSFSVMVTWILGTQEDSFMMLENALPFTFQLLLTTWISDLLTLMTLTQ